MIAEEEKERGNVCFKKKDYKQAIKHYTNAINSSNPQNLHICYTNRSLTFFKLNSFEKSLEDAEEAIKIDEKWEKSHFRKILALISLKKFYEANESLKVWLGLINFKENIQQISDITFKLQKNWVDFDFSLITKDIPQISVNYIGSEKGKGVFANREYKFGDVIFIEEPLVSHRCIDEINIESCANCLRTFLPPKKAYPFDKKFINKESYNYVSKPLQCQTCGLEKYCSESCQKTAWSNYHRLLCPKGYSEQEEINKLKQLAIKLNRTNPLLISKMFAMMAERMIKLKNDNFKVEKSFEIFSRFIQNEEFHEGDEECLELIQKQLMKNEIPKDFDKILNIKIYRSLNGLILRNATTIIPKSDFHLYLQNQILSETQLMNLNRKMNKTDSLIGIHELLTSNYMNSLCINGSAPLTIHNSMNHNCEPNVTSIGNPGYQNRRRIMFILYGL
eukprot:gene6622-10788_t